MLLRRLRSFTLGPFELPPPVLTDPTPTLPTPVQEKERKVRALVAAAGFTGAATLECYKSGPLIGQGAFSKVYTAWHRLTGAKVALKQYAATKLERSPALLAAVCACPPLRRSCCSPAVSYPGLRSLKVHRAEGSRLCLPGTTAPG